MFFVYDYSLSSLNKILVCDTKVISFYLRQFLFVLFMVYFFYFLEFYFLH